MARHPLSKSYRALGLQHGASLAEVRKAYRALAHRMHPDRDPGEATVERFKEITAAYNALIAHLTPAPEGSTPRSAPKPAPAGAKAKAPRAEEDPKEREAARERWRQQAAAWRARRMARAAEERQAAKKAAEDAAREARRAATPEVKPAADHLEPEGHAEASVGWLGRLMSRKQDITRRLPVRAETILHGGTVHIAITRRAFVDGALRERRETVRVQVPPGARRGDRLRLQGKGHARADGQCGDLLLSLEPASLSGFARVDADLHGEATVPPEVFQAGGVVETAGLEGPVKVRLPAGSAPGTRLRLRGQGLPSWGGGDRGDLILTLQAMGA